MSRSFDEHDLGDESDSDKTVDDSSLPHTPKSPGGAIRVVSKNQHLFAEKTPEAADMNLLPRGLAAKGEIWCQYYAEQLRSWGLWIKAAELEKAMVMSKEATNPPSTTESGFSPDGISPYGVDTSNRNNLCAICATLVHSMEQSCPSCLHVAHLSCLAGYASDLYGDGDGDFTCPTGCGCICSELAFVVEEVRQPPLPQDKPTFKKKPSFTDPRRWRARVEGDSW